MGVKREELASHNGDADMNDNQIQVVKGSNGFVVYGAFGSVMHADSKKVVTYCNLNESANGYKAMLKSLNKAK